ncbi:MAG: anhydro-N-acetylmuramic acid kinase [Eubacterium sp.]|jgi:anhydro-N-acetylmuramic acid kinase|nr:anhydro-N-acetylmuramic acid kinase [Eubacterium sp.]
MLEQMTGKTVRRAVGLMSGTSVDGIDAAVVEIMTVNDGIKVKLCAFDNIPYSGNVRKKIMELFDVNVSTVDKLGYMNFLLGELFAEAALQIIKKAGLEAGDIDFIGSHGQTVYHQPQVSNKDGYDIRYTVQIGEGAVISARTGIPCVSDFRVADMAAGGQGAPLVPFTEYLLYSDEDKNVLLQNIGGIGNITIIPSGKNMHEISAFDTGPGNMIIDGLVQKTSKGKLLYDPGGEIARKGTVNESLLKRLANNPYFDMVPPKSTGRELFGKDCTEMVYQYMLENNISNEDGIATVTYFTAWSIADSYRRYIKPVYSADYIVLGGGGSYNSTLVNYIKTEMSVYNVQTYTQEQLGYNSDAKEAIAFAVLADYTLAAKANNIPGVTGASKAVVMGKISL